MYNNPYPMYNNPFGNSFTQPKMEITKVNGRNGAEAYQLAPNSSVLLLDYQEPIVWLKTTDGAGYPTITPYTITPYKPEQPTDIKTLEQRIERLEMRLNESYSNTTNASTTTPDEANAINA